MAITIKSKLPVGNALAWGVAAETGINIKRFQVRFYPEINAKLPGAVGSGLLRVVSATLSRDIEIEGEITGTAGVMAYTVAAALTFANNIAGFGAGGTVYLDEATVTKVRGGWASISVKASSIGTI
jgi:hypothetical protein